MADRQERRGPPPRRLILEVGEPKKSEDLGWYFTAVAVVLRGKNPEPNAEVQFFLNKLEDGTGTQTTDSDGRATMQFFPNTGGHIVEAQIKGEPLTKRGTKVLVKEEMVVKEKKEEKPTLRVSQVNVIESDLGGGKRLLTFETLTDDDDRVPQAKLRIQEQGIQPKGFKDIRTDKTGTKSVVFEVGATPKVLRIIPLGEPAESFTWTLYPKQEKNKEKKNG